MYIGHSRQYNHGVINYLIKYVCEVLYVQCDVTHLQGKDLCDRQVILRKQSL